jgi:hypothetical protein
MPKLAAADIANPELNRSKDDVVTSTTVEPEPLSDSMAKGSDTAFSNMTVTRRTNAMAATTWAAITGINAR